MENYETDQMELSLTSYCKNYPDFFQHISIIYGNSPNISGNMEIHQKR